MPYDLDAALLALVAACLSFGLLYLICRAVHRNSHIAAIRMLIGLGVIKLVAVQLAIETLPA